MSLGESLLPYKQGTGLGAILSSLQLFSPSFASSPQKNLAIQYTWHRMGRVEPLPSKQGLGGGRETLSLKLHLRGLQTTTHCWEDRKVWESWRKREPHFLIIPTLYQSLCNVKLMRKWGQGRSWLKCCRLPQSLFLQRYRFP